jgi:hypothetical protein
MCRGGSRIGSASIATLTNFTARTAAPLPPLRCSSNQTNKGHMPTHWKSLTDREYIYAFDLDGHDMTVTIEKVAAGVLTSAGGKTNKKPVVFFKGATKGLALNATNAKTIAAMYGNYTEKWVGQRITLFPSMTQFGAEQMECIRIRPTVPPAPEAKK